MKNYTAAGRRE